MSEKSNPPRRVLKHVHLLAASYYDEDYWLRQKWRPRRHQVNTDLKEQSDACRIVSSRDERDQRSEASEEFNKDAPDLGEGKKLENRDEEIEQGDMRRDFDYEMKDSVPKSAQTTNVPKDCNVGHDNSKEMASVQSGACLEGEHRVVHDLQKLNSIVALQFGDMVNSDEAARIGKNNMSGGAVLSERGSAATSEDAGLFVAVSDGREFGSGGMQELHEKTLHVNPESESQLVLRAVVEARVGSGEIQRVAGGQVEACP